MQQSQMLALSMGYGKGVGTTRYMAPEVVLHGEASKYTDIWSLGVILYEILYKKHPILK